MLPETTKAEALKGRMYERAVLERSALPLCWFDAAGYRVELFIFSDGSVAAWQASKKDQGLGTVVGAGKDFTS